jgi:hypothetical protein
LDRPGGTASGSGAGIRCRPRGESEGDREVTPLPDAREVLTSLTANRIDGLKLY